MRSFTGLSAALATLSFMCPGLSAAARARARAKPGPARVTLIQHPALDAFAPTGNRVPGRQGSARCGAALLLALMVALGVGAGGTGAWAQAASGAAGTDPAAALSPAQRAEVLDLLRHALRTDPSLLRDAIGAMARADADDTARSRRDALRAEADALFRDPADPVMGNPDGDVTLVEFFDARCGYCKSMAPAMAELLRRDNKVRLVLKDLPILGPNSVLASRALLAAQRQNKYGALHEALMRLRGEPTEAALQAEATRLGLDWPRLRRDMDDPAIAAKLAENLRLARALGIEGTPALVTPGTLLPGAVDLAALEELVAEARRGG